MGKGGVSSVLEPYLARVVHALNHLVQPAGGEEIRMTAAAKGRGGGGSRSGSSHRGHRDSVGGSGGSQSRSQSRGRDFSPVGSVAGGGEVSPARSSASVSVADPRARVRLQAINLLGTMAAKDGKALYPHWALFFPPYASCGVGDETGSGTAGDKGVLTCFFHSRVISLVPFCRV